MVRNGTGFWLHYKALNVSTNNPELNDAANHTLVFVIDGIEVAPINTPEDIALGECRIFVDATESNGAKFIRVGGISSTADVIIISADVITDLLKPGVPFVGCYTAWDVTANAPKTGDAANHSMIIAQDNTSSAASGQAEVNAVTIPGTYKISCTDAQSNGKAVSILGESVTANVNIIPTELAPFDVDYPAEADVRLDTDYAEGTLTGVLNPTIKGPVKLLKLDTGIKVIKL